MYCLGVGAIIALMWIELAVATLYFAVSARQIDQGVVPAAPGSPAAPAA